MLIKINLRIIVEVIKFQYYSLSLHPNYIVTIFNWALSNWPKMVGLKFRKLSMSNGKAFFFSSRLAVSPSDWHLSDILDSLDEKI